MVVYLVSSAFASRLISVLATTEAAVFLYGMHASIQCISIIFQCKILWSDQGTWDGWGMLGDLGVLGRLFL
jgi:hypothetical protein